MRREESEEEGGGEGRRMKEKRRETRWREMEGRDISQVGSPSRRREEGLKLPRRIEGNRDERVGGERISRGTKAGGQLTCQEE